MLNFIRKGTWDGANPYVVNYCTANLYFLCSQSINGAVLKIKLVERRYYRNLVRKSISEDKKMADGEDKSKEDDACQASVCISLRGLDLHGEAGIPNGWYPVQLHGNWLENIASGNKSIRPI